MSEKENSSVDIVTLPLLLTLQQNFLQENLHALISSLITCQSVISEVLTCVKIFKMHNANGTKSCLLKGNQCFKKNFKYILSYVIQRYLCVSE